MSIITFWNDNREQSGRTLASVAVATMMAIERNSKILLISTSVSDPTIKNCFWEQENKNTSFFNSKSIGIEVESGIEGLLKLSSSNKLVPSIITDYTKVVFKDRLEVITGINSTKKTLIGKFEDLENVAENYLELIKVANQYYDVVIVDLDKNLNHKVRDSILQVSDVNVYVLSQKLDSLNTYNEVKKEKHDLMQNRSIPVLGKYMSKYKYNSKNVARFLKEKKEMDLVPYNLLYMEACEEAKVVDLLLKLRNIKDKTDENYIFMQSILNLTNNIMKKLQELQMRMR